jgi:hypothetical protein
MLTPWRNGNASDSRPEDWGFDSLWGHFFFCYDASTQKAKNTTSTRFELARAEPSRFLIYLLNHSDTTSPRTPTKKMCRNRGSNTGPLDLQSNALPTELSQQQKRSTATRFELARAEPSRFRIYLLNHSDTLPTLGQKSSHAGI